MVHSMADSKASGFSKVVQKHSLRAKERVSPVGGWVNEASHNTKSKYTVIALDV